jgi:hypothetical protein
MGGVKDDAYIAKVANKSYSTTSVQRPNKCAIPTSCAIDCIWSQLTIFPHPVGPSTAFRPLIITGMGKFCERPTSARPRPFLIHTKALSPSGVRVPSGFTSSLHDCTRSGRKVLQAGKLVRLLTSIRRSLSFKRTSHLQYFLLLL